MIKKFNELMDDLPIIVKVIIGIVLIGLNLIIINLFFAVDVFAATLNPDTNQIQVKNIISGTETYITIGQNQNYTVQVTETVPLFVSNWINLPTGVIDGKWSISFPVATGTTCNDLKQQSRFIVSVNDLQYNATKSFTACTISNNVASLQMKYNTTNTIANATFKTIYYIPGQAIGGTYKSYQQTDFVAKDYASNIDIENGVINIINNAIQNATNVMANQNNDTNALIDAIREQNQTCEEKNYNNEPVGITESYLNTTGNTNANTTWNISEYIEMQPNKTYKIILTGYGTYDFSNTAYCIYDKNKTIESCVAYGTTREFTIRNTTKKYIRYSYRTITGYNINFNGQFCKTNTEAINERLDRQLEFWEEIKQMEDDDFDETNGLLESIVAAISNFFDDDTDEPDDDISDLANQMGSNTVISDLLLLPVSLFQSVVNSLQGTCSTYTLGTLYNHTLTLPCINLQSILGSTLYNVIDVLISGIFILAIRKKFIEIFNNFTSLKVERNELE